MRVLFKSDRGPAETSYMKAIFIILLFPSVSFAFIKDIPYKKTEICEKIKTVFSKATADSLKADADYYRASAFSIDSKQS